MLPWNPNLLYVPWDWAEEKEQLPAMGIETGLSRAPGVTGADSLNVVVEASQVIGAMNLQDVGARFPGGRKGHWAMRKKWRK